MHIEQLILRDPIQEGLIKINNKLMNDIYYDTLIFLAGSHYLFLKRISKKNPVKDDIEQFFEYMDGLNYSREAVLAAANLVKTHKISHYKYPLKNYGLTYSYEGRPYDDLIVYVYTVNNDDDLADFRYRNCSMTLWTTAIYEHFQKNFLPYKPFSEILKLFKSSIEHELTHFTQFFHNWHPAQTSYGAKLNKDKNSRTNHDKYLLSPLEFDPHIKTSIAEFTDILNNYNGDKRQMFNHFTGLATAPNNYFAFKPSDFFKTLKKYDYDRYKKAIKYFSSMVNLK